MLEWVVEGGVGGNEAFRTSMSEGHRWTVREKALINMGMELRRLLADQPSPGPTSTAKKTQSILDNKKNYEDAYTNGFDSHWTTNLEHRLLPAPLDNCTWMGLTIPSRC